MQKPQFPLEPIFACDIDQVFSEVVSTCTEQIILLYFRSVTGSPIVIYLCTNTNDDSVSYEMDVIGMFALTVQFTSKSPTGRCGLEIQGQSCYIRISQPVYDCT